MFGLPFFRPPKPVAPRPQKVAQPGFDDSIPPGLSPKQILSEIVEEAIKLHGLSAARPAKLVRREGNQVMVLIELQGDTPEQDTMQMGDNTAAQNAASILCYSLQRSELVDQLRVSRHGFGLYGGRHLVPGNWDAPLLTPLGDKPALNACVVGQHCFGGCFRRLHELDSQPSALLTIDQLLNATIQPDPTHRLTKVLVLFEEFPARLNVCGQFLKLSLTFVEQRDSQQLQSTN